MNLILTRPLTRRWNRHDTVWNSRMQQSVWSDGTLVPANFSTYETANFYDIVQYWSAIDLLSQHGNEDRFVTLIKIVSIVAPRDQSTFLADKRDQVWHRNIVHTSTGIEWPQLRHRQHTQNWGMGEAVGTVTPQGWLVFGVARFAMFREQMGMRNWSFLI